MKPFLITLLAFVVILVVCIIRAALSKKDIAFSVCMLMFYVIIPIIGNLMVILSDSYRVNVAGYMLYLIGTDWLFFFLVEFSMRYCDYKFKLTPLHVIILALTILDSVSVLLNPIFHHVFGLEQIVLADGDLYYKIVSYTGHVVHLVFSYSIVLFSFAVFVKKTFSVSRLYIEKYLVILISLVVVAIWESWYVLSKSPVDHSMLGYGVCGILMYYFTIEYLPFFLTAKLLSSIVSNMSGAVLFLDNKDNCIYFNESASRLFFLADGDYVAAKKTISGIITDGDMHNCESLQVIRTFEVEGSERIFEIEYQKIYDRLGIYAGSFVSIKDRTEEEAEKREEQYLATHDSLTGLYNREYFLHKMEQKLRENPDTEYLVICSDIKEFKLVNDIFGREAGDEILKNVAQNVEGYASENSIFGRIGGDMFGLMMRKQDFDERLFVRGSKGFIHKEGNVSYPITIHIGIYEVKDRTVPPSIMVDRAFFAMEEIKNSVQQRVAWYDGRKREEVLWEQQVTASFEDALEQHQFKPYLQPQVNAEGVMEGAEVLARWEHPTLGLLGPSKFIEILEKSGDIVRLDRYMWEASCAILSRWRDEGKSSLYLSVNISPKDFYFVDVYEEITHLVKFYGISPSQLRLEITESVMINDVERKMQIINWLRGDGFIVEMDDFGSGYSSLNLLKNLQFDILKLDMLFLRSSNDEEKARTILQFIITMAHQLHMPVITEGVETKEQIDFLTSAGCDMFQGFYFSKPISLEEFESRNFS